MMTTNENIKTFVEKRSGEERRTSKTREEKKTALKLANHREEPIKTEEKQNKLLMLTGRLSKAPI